MAGPEYLNHFSKLNLNGKKPGPITTDRVFLCVTIFNNKTMSQLQIEEYYLEALDQLEYGETVEAKRSFEKIIQENPEYGRAYNYLGWIFHKYFYDFRTADEMYRLAIKYNPEFPLTYLNYICLLVETDKWEHLKYVLDKAIKVPGTQKSVILYHYGRLYEYNENFETALEFYAKGMKATVDEQELGKFEESINRCYSKKSHHKHWNSVII